MKINLNNQDKVEEQLEKVNGRASAHVIDSVCELIEFANDAEAELATLLPKAAWKGALVLCRPEGPSANSYKFRGVSTTCVLERGARDWFLVSAEKDWVYPRSRHFCDITLTGVQGRAAILHLNKRLRAEFGASGLTVDTSDPAGRALEEAACKLIGLPVPTWPSSGLAPANDNRPVSDERQTGIAMSQPVLNPHAHEEAIPNSGQLTV